MKESICIEANRIVTEDRQHSYGHPFDHFTHVAKLANAYGFRLERGEKVWQLNPEDIPAFMTLVKISREHFQHKRDNLVDIAGLAQTSEMVHERKNKVSA